MWLIDSLAEKHIQNAISDGLFDKLPAQGKPLELEDETFIPETLRTGYRLLKNAGYLPPELLLRQEALQLSTLLQSLHKEHENYKKISQQLALLILKLNQAGVDTQFLSSPQYQQKLTQKILHNRGIDKK